MSEHIFKSFFMGGFECSTHRNDRGKRLDLIASTRHDEFAEKDYTRMLEIGMRTARDGMRWHLIEKEAFRYDFSSLETQIKAAKQTGMEVIWDYFHYGFPEDVDIMSPAFVERFARFAGEVTVYLTQSLGEKLYVCPINEISFFAWIAGEKGVFFPCLKRRGDELKQQLVKTSVAAVVEIRKANPKAKIVFTDPAIHVVPQNESGPARAAAANYRRAQFQGFDLLDQSSAFDIAGLNYYFHNQWRHPSRRKVPRGHASYRPFSRILREYFDRYQHPLLIAETGIEDDERADWFRYVCEETKMARESGVLIEGICLYPIVNHPGWADDRHCHNGLWDYANDLGDREVYKPLADEIIRQIPNFL